MEEGQYDGKRDPSWVEDRGVIYDMSWHLNNVLWDEYFFSTLPYRNDEYRDKIDSEFVMPQNPRLRYYVSENSTDQYMRRLSDTDLHSSDNEDQFSRNAALHERGRMESCAFHILRPKHRRLQERNRKYSERNPHAQVGGAAGR